MKQWIDFIKIQEIELGEETSKKWLSSLKIISFDAGNIYLQAPDSIHAFWFEEHIRPKLKNNLLNSNNRPIKVHLQILNEKQKKREEKKTIVINLNSDKLDPSSTFSTFFENEKNVLAFKFLNEISSKNESNLSGFNPILIHGPKDSGKSHLLMATASAFKEKGKKVFYVKAQSFTEHVVTAMRLSSITQFRNTYRNVEVLIVDDIHELANKNATQEEFFHTFNALHTQGSQIVLSSNVPPFQIKDIEPRLISRFEWGISLSLDKVDPSSLQIILENKLKAFNLNFTKDAKDFLLKTFSSPSNIQKAIEAIILRSETSNISLLDLNTHLQDLIKEQNEKVLSFDQIIKIVAKHFGLNPEDILGKSQTKECSLPRQIAMYLCREKLKTPYQAIGKLFSRDHSTVMSNIKGIEQKKINKSPEVFFPIQEIDRSLKLS
jgi:chromosomal replication initiator protein